MKVWSHLYEAIDFTELRMAQMVTADLKKLEILCRDGLSASLSLSIKDLKTNTSHGGRRN